MQTQLRVSGPIQVQRPSWPLRPQVPGKPGGKQLVVETPGPWRTLGLMTALIGESRCSGFQLEHPIGDGAVILNLQGGVRNGSQGTRATRGTLDCEVETCATLTGPVWEQTVSPACLPLWQPGARPPRVLNSNIRKQVPRLVSYLKITVALQGLASQEVALKIIQAKFKMFFRLSHK